jgi:hypothetical protein
MHHYIRDVCFGEDASRVSRAHQAMAAIRNTIIGIMHLNRIPNIAAQLRSCHRDPYRLPLQLLGLTRGDFLSHLESAGTGPDVASFVGAASLRMIRAGMDRRPLTGQELDGACRLLGGELADGALGVGSALICAPGSYASSTSSPPAPGRGQARRAVHLAHPQ